MKNWFASRDKIKTMNQHLCNTMYSSMFSSRTGVRKTLNFISWITSYDQSFLLPNFYIKQECKLYVKRSKTFKGLVKTSVVIYDCPIIRNTYFCCKFIWQRNGISMLWETFQKSNYSICFVIVSMLILIVSIWTFLKHLIRHHKNTIRHWKYA